MTVTSPEWDRLLRGYSAFARDGVCHANVSDYDEHGAYPRSECGIELTVREKRDSAPRERFDDDPEIEMCEECWPRTVTTPDEEM